ncbi:helix-turn-helix domain-containing protein [Priestia koreensis]|uniref:helix-turn-helix domain-containing protein n=1 Tax=Priestia koreensis TaxID=284581 RepID=UPI001F57ECAF|nr:helix-turn-helix domain-containing protein [Priestia koreensis]UNL83265.1 tetratricopeptide repeat protein [Priestia koreensis]
MESVGQRIKERRKMIGLTQSEISGPNLSVGMISLIERNLTNPSLKTLEQIAARLGVSVQSLLENKSEKGTIAENKQETITLLQGLMKAKRYKEVKEILAHLKEKDLDLSVRGAVAKIDGDLALQSDQYDQALIYFNDALIYLPPYELEQLISIYISLSKAYFKTRDYHKSIEASIKGLLLLESNYAPENTLLYLNLYFTQAYSYCRIQEFEKALGIMSQAFQLMKEQNCYFKAGSFYMLHGVVYLYLKKFAKGIVETEKAIRLLKENEEWGEVAGCLTNLGILYRETGEFNKSLNYLQECLELAISHQKQKHVLNSYYEMALTYYKAGNLVEAEKLCKEHRDHVDGDKELKATINFLLSHVAFKQNASSLSLLYIEEAYEDASLIADNSLMTRCLQFKSTILHTEGRLEEAYQCLLCATQMFEHQTRKYYESFPETRMEISGVF